jgi:hypothetical protein
MLLRSSLVLTLVNMALAAPLSDDTTGLSLLDIVAPESALALKAMIDNSSDQSYVKPDLSDVNVLKVTIMDGTNDSVLTHMEMPTNENAAAYQKAYYGEAGGQSEVKATDPVSLSKRASGCGQYCAYRSQCTRDRNCPACYHQQGNTSHQKACTGQYSFQHTHCIRGLC